MAVSMAEKILGEFRDQVQELTLVPSGGGVFEVDVDQNRVFSKKQLGRHAEWPEVRDAIRRS